MQNETLDQLRQMNAMVHRDRVVLENRLGEIETSLGWHLILKLRRLRARILRPGTLLDRSYTLSSRFVKTARSVGLHVALRKARERVARKLGKFGRGGSAPGSGLSPRSFARTPRWTVSASFPGGSWGMIPAPRAKPPAITRFCSSRIPPAGPAHRFACSGCWKS